MRLLKMFFVICVLSLPFLIASFSYAMPPKPGPNFIWVQPHRAPNGAFIEGHWRPAPPPSRPGAGPGPGRRPPMPGPNFIWVEPHITHHGIFIEGHWQYVGRRPPRGRAWVEGHYDPSGHWGRGHWRDIHAPRPGCVWVPGYRGHRGRWIPGYWR
jgi:hypothetical protein